MFSELFSIIGPVILCAAIGVFWARSKADFPAEFISRIVMMIGAPCLILSSLLNVSIDSSVLFQVAWATLFITLTMMVVGGLVVKLMKLDWPTYLPPLMFANNANMGLSICMFAFGAEGLALGVSYFVTVTFIHFTLGILIVSAGQGHWSDRLKDLLKQPILYAMILGVLLLQSDSDLPKWLSNTVDLLAGITIPLMLITLGYSLSSLKLNTWHRSFLLSFLRVFGGLLIAWLVCDLMGIEGITRGVVLLQGAMPVAVFNYLFAHRYKCDASEVAGMVIVSTLMAFAFLPFLVGYLIQ